jgi:hypothetical protein
MSGEQFEEVPADEPVAEDKPEYIEFLGTDPRYGTEFYGVNGSHTIGRTHMKDQHDIDLGTKELVWKAGKDGRFLVPVADMSPEAAEHLANDPMFKRVTL